MLKDMLKKVEDRVESIKNWYNNDVMGYHYERIQNVYKYEDGSVERLGFDTIVKLDKNNKVKGHCIVGVQL